MSIRDALPADIFDPVSGPEHGAAADRFFIFVARGVTFLPFGTGTLSLSAGEDGCRNERAARSVTL